MSSIAQKLGGIVGAAFASFDLPREFGRVIVSDRPDLAQFQCNGALAAAKAAKKNPREVAGHVAEELKKQEAFSLIEIAGPGFINLKVRDEYLAAHLQDAAGDARLGLPVTGKGTVVVDYGGPNVAKAMHVGHLRPTIIGEAVKRIIRHAGFNAQGDVHMGDWGLPMGQIISEFSIRHPDWIYFSPDFKGDYPEAPPFTYADLETVYPLASQACKDDPARRELARKATAELQDGRRGYRALWRHFMVLSKADMKKNFDSLDVSFELWKGEADVHEQIAVVADDLKARGLAVMSDGALVVPVVEESDNKPIPPLMYYKSDGAVSYATTDVVTIYDRWKTYADLAGIVYVVDKRQDLHFEQVFRTARKGHYADGVAFKFIGFGTLNGPDNKPFKSRDGGVMKFSDLVAAAHEKARTRLAEAELPAEIGAEERGAIAHKVAVATLKFADLQNQAQSDYIFDLDRMSSFEGKTGPYLLYQTVRITSLLGKAGAFDDRAALVLSDVDRPLALLLTEWPDVFDGALRNYTPHLLCDYAYRVAQAFSAFYGACHILSEADKDLRASRLALCALTARMLTTILDLLGISVPERM